MSGHDDSTTPPQLPTEQEVFHELDTRKSTQAIKKLAAHEQALVTVNESGQADAGRGTGVDSAVERPGGAHPHGKTTSRSAPLTQTAHRFLQGAGLESAIGVQKKQSFARSMCRTEIHLGSPTARPLQEHIRSSRQAAGGVVAAAIHYNDLLRSLFPDEPESLGKAAFFVPCGYDD
jgi:hypothetical protein